MKVILFLLLLFTHWSHAEEICNLALHEPAGTPLSEAIEQINQERITQHLDLAPITIEKFRNWYQSERFFSFSKKERTYLDSFIQRNLLPPGTSLKIDTKTWTQTRVNFRLDHPSDHYSTVQFTVLQGHDYLTWENTYRNDLESQAGLIDEVTLNGSPLSLNQSGHFPKTVPVQIRQIQLDYENFHEPALDVQFQIRSDNLKDLAHYFANAYSEAQTLVRLTALLGKDTKKWISIRELLQGWPAQWMNRFPAEKTVTDNTSIIYNGQTDLISANDVCHGVARQFFQNELSNTRASDRSTEATEYLLRTHYTLLADGIEPTFGDYLYLPGAHSIRFILKDPASGRWIGFSAWSSADTPYRLWWVDQDYLGPYNSRLIEPHPDFPETMDIWRRTQ